MAGICSLEGCEKPKDSHGYCGAHAARFRKYGDPNKLMKVHRGLIDIEEVNGCFICTSLRRNKAGYPVLNRNHKVYYASRFVYEQCFGSIENGLVVRHKCDNPSCVNPEHLELGTIQDNINDMVTRGRNAKGEKNGQSKLTENEVREIRALLDLGVNPREISKKFNTSYQNVFDIRARRSWKHVK